MWPKIQYYLFLYCLWSCGEAPEEGQVAYREKVPLPAELVESSALEMVSGNPLIWSINDSGNSPALYGFDLQGELKARIDIGNAENTDWEDLTSDPSGKLYIADIGNNSNTRRDLCILVIDSLPTSGHVKMSARKIPFSYPEQKQYPPPREERFFDAEALLWQNGKLLLFTKNKTRNPEGNLVYSLNPEAGQQLARLEGRLAPAGKKTDYQITSADLSPDGKHIALLTEKTIRIYSLDHEFFWKTQPQILKLPDNTQKEGLCYDAEGRIWLSDERKGKRSGMLYRL